MLQLKRFDLDMTTLSRRKLNERVTFPFLLNMNKYMGEKGVEYAKQRVKDRQDGKLEEDQPEGNPEEASAENRPSTTDASANEPTEEHRTADATLDKEGEEGDVADGLAVDPSESAGDDTPIGYSALPGASKDEAAENEERAETGGTSDSVWGSAWDSAGWTDIDLEDRPRTKRMTATGWDTFEWDRFEADRGSSSNGTTSTLPQSQATFTEVVPDVSPEALKKQAEQYLEEGPEVFELFAVLVHSGKPGCYRCMCLVDSNTFVNRWSHLWPLLCSH